MPRAERSPLGVGAVTCSAVAWGAVEQRRWVEAAAASELRVVVTETIMLLDQMEADMRRDRARVSVLKGRSVWSGGRGIFINAGGRWRR